MKAFLSLLVVLVAPAAALAAPRPTVIDCAKQPAVSITKGKGTYKITGSCKSVSVSGGQNTITIDTTTTLSIAGSSNTITVDKADKIAAIGSNNKVTYTSGQPKVSSIGKGNVITGPTSASSGAIDCATTPSHSISDNDGSYTFVGACDLISIDGNDNNLTIASAKSISITGNNNNLAVTAVDKLSIPGNDNNVSWKKGITTPRAKISVVGNDNKVSQSK